MSATTNSMNDPERAPEPAEDAPLDENQPAGANQPLSWESMLELLEDGDVSEALAEELDDYTTSEDVIEDFADRQAINAGGGGRLREKLRQHHAETPQLSADDIDAAWEQADVGQETVGGSAHTPDQDQVDELGEAAGITYADDEPLETRDRLAERDRRRWELEPGSADEEE
ncbi:MAG: DUF6335 family protein [Candidatus Promineifilaceae bacterium]